MMREHNLRLNAISRAHNTTKFDEEDSMSVNDENMLKEVKEISKRGNNAEVKQEKDGTWVIYEVHKKKKKVG